MAGMDQRGLAELEVRRGTVYDKQCKFCGVDLTGISFQVPIQSPEDHKGIVEWVAACYSCGKERGGSCDWTPREKEPCATHGCVMCGGEICGDYVSTIGVEGRYVGAHPECI